jgi:hypothetical protein
MPLLITSWGWRVTSIFSRVKPISLCSASSRCSTMGQNEPTEETIKTDSDRCAVDALGKLVIDATVAKKARERRQIAVKRPAQPGQRTSHASPPTQLRSAMKKKISRKVDDPRKNESRNGALLQLQGERPAGHWHLHEERVEAQIGAVLIRGRSAWSFVFLTRAPPEIP